ncbi:MAG TPA: hypothetical protein PLS90_06975 [Candidatus Sumerlaeota bacterium]|nr:hypothetical protein [Candidatus Sumerlaeota bacterium]HPK02185.1 hypothetical protein [Candidatus Sumerlaeota bacterium]
MTSSDLPLAERLKRQSHRICTEILQSDVEWVDIAIQIERMRAMCEAEAPDKLELFEALYVARFTRLWQQWREPEERAARPPIAANPIIEGEWRETRG